MFLAVAGTAAGLLLTSVGIHANRTGPRQVPSASPSPSPAPSAPATSAWLTAAEPLFGVYSAGFKESDCFGSCAPGTPDAAIANQDLARMAQLQSLHVNLVINNENIMAWFVKAPKAVYAFLDALHAHGIHVAYALASEPGAWFSHGLFNPAVAEANFAATDPNHTGVSGLDGHLDILYMSHQVLDWANHQQRVEMYQIAKRWFPHTILAAYYAGFDRPYVNANHTHGGGPGGLWSSYQYGPGETDLVLLNIRRNANGLGENIPASTTRAFDVSAFHNEAVKDVGIIEAATPGMPVVISTNLASDPIMNADPSAMWAPADILSWYHALAGINGVAGTILRSFGRFQYDLGNPRFTGQQQAFASAGALAAQRRRVA